jgi:hypothetical protein
MTRNCGLAPARDPHRHHQHIGHHDVALHIDKTPARLGLQARNQRDGLAGLRVGAATRCTRRFDIAAGQQVHGLAQMRRASAAGRRQVGVQRVVQLGAQLQAQALTQIARAHARGLQAVQQAPARR